MLHRLLCHPVLDHPRCDQATDDLYRQTIDSVRAEAHSPTLGWYSQHQEHMATHDWRDLVKLDRVRIHREDFSAVEQTAESCLLAYMDMTVAGGGGGSRTTHQAQVEDYAKVGC